MDNNVIIPAYEPDERLPALVKRLKDLGENVIVVNDGSGGDYAHLFAECEASGAAVLCHEQNRGKGAALKTGIAYLKASGAEKGAVTADADAQHSVEDIERVAQKLNEKPDTLILGGRRFTGKVPLRSRLGNTVTRWVFRLASGVNIYDTQSGLRGLPRGLFEELLDVPGDRYEYEMNMLLAIKGWGIAYEEIPIETIYSTEKYVSHFNAVKDGIRVFSRIIKYTGVSLICSAVDYGGYLIAGIWLSATRSYIAARVVSSVVNYELNSRVVFSSKPTVKNAVEYIALTVTVMLLGSWGVGMLCGLGLGRLLSKFIVDNILFVLNYIVQKKVIFKSTKKDKTT